MDTSFEVVLSSKEIFVEASKKTNGMEWETCFHGNESHCFLSVMTQSCRVLEKEQQIDNVFC